MTTDAPERLYLLELAVGQGNDVPMPGYLIRMRGGTNVLVDTGWPKSWIGLYEASPSLGIRMEERHYVVHQLQALGLTPRDINILVCTHFDPDHTGNHDEFPWADLVVQRAHYEFARAGGHPRFELHRAHWDHPHLHYRLVDGDTELLPGLDLIETGGHVPGHQSVLVRLPRTGRVLLAIDALPDGQDLQPEAPFDMDETAMHASARKLLALARREQVALIVYGHDAAQWKTLRKAPAFYA